MELDIRHMPLPLKEEVAYTMLSGGLHDFFVLPPDLISHRPVRFSTGLFLFSSLPLSQVSLH